MKICDGYQGGKFNVLRLVRHATRGIDQTAQDDIELQLPPHADLLFWRHWYWDAA